MPSSPRALTRLAVLLALAGVALLGCGDDGSGDATVVDEATTTTVEDPSSDDTPEDDDTSEDEGDATDDDDATEDDGADDDDTTTTEDGSGPSSGSSALADTLLTVDDLPAGFVAGDEEVSEDGVMDDGSGLCEGDSTFPSSVEEIERSFNTEDFEVLMGSSAGRFEGSPAEVLQVFRDEAERCDGVEDTTYVVRDVDLGDEALLLELSGPEGFAAQFWIARVDDVVLGVSFIAENLNALDGEALLGIMVERAGG